MDDSVNGPQPEPVAPDVEGEEVIPLIFNVPVGIASRYAHHLLVQTTENEAILSFFEVFPPLVGNLEELKEKLKGGVRADCVARVTIARTRYPDFVKAMIGQLTAEEKKTVCE